MPKKDLPLLLSSATIVVSLFIDLPEMENNSANKFFDGLASGKPIMLNYGGWQSKLIEKIMLVLSFQMTTQRKLQRSLINILLIKKN